MTLKPTEENAERLTLSMTIHALALDTRTLAWMINTLGLDPQSYPPIPPMPIVPIPRLASNDLATYQVISNRNLLQTARGGIDRADYTLLTGIYELGDQKEVLFRVLTDETRIKARLGDSIQSGSFLGKIVEILDIHDIVLDRNGERWLLTTGESLNEAFPLPPETAVKSE